MSKQHRYSIVQYIFDRTRKHHGLWFVYRTNSFFFLFFLQGSSQPRLGRVDSTGGLASGPEALCLGLVHACQGDRARLGLAV